MDTDGLVKIKSGISQAYWCDTSDTITKFQAAELAFDTSNKQNLSWFDKLFEGGISLPRGNSNILRPITMLVSGPPGCGKTTLITELCYRLAVNEQGNEKALSTLYVSTDAETVRMIGNAVNLGWDKAEDILIPFDPTDRHPRFRKGLQSMVGVWGREKFLKTIEDQDMLSSMVEAAVTSLDKWVLKANVPDNIMKRLKYRFVTDPIEDASGGKIVVDGEKYIPDILVVDSLNILNPEGQMKFFQSFVKACKATKLVIFVLNTGMENQEHKLWEYFSDIVVQLDHQYIHDYYVRTIEVVKARYQSHWWGKHQLKIYANPKSSAVPEETNIAFVDEYNTMMKRSHPYQTTGGVFIFPSIHSYLSVYKRKALLGAPSSSQIGAGSGTPARDHTYPEKLNDVFQIPKGRCTAFIGERGGHKSHLGYLHLLNRLINHTGESCLIVSLREDEVTTKTTLQNIAKQEFGCDHDKLNHFEKDNHLEVLYFPPGYITPEEFFHRMFISVHRLKKNGSPLTVMFNSLDQISARFPLCAKQEIFIPGIVQTLSGEGVTSVCVAVDEPGQPVQQYGLLPMADLIVSFSMRRFTAKDYYSHVGRGWQKEFDNKKDLHHKFQDLQEYTNNNAVLYREAIVLQVIRFSGGERAGKRGILELVNEAELKLFPYSKAGLHFTPLSEDLRQGESLSGCS
jgi:KaiC/GvpD/RAD55 family RecA-like ATPase